ncbi:hypothetical protein RhiirC2_796367 [Rhizophagus irregularis]|uniref:Uncharacterized protein n=1 Tax=Rhizophagus irregularis TaxID=588596 RepID=A0A2N1M9U2_9GLOM|nr:hypothetical protein RhiirC2_796367 [Rhizophagus irregularis]
MSYWLPVFTFADERSYNPCPGCSYNVPALSKKSAIRQRYNSEKCFFNVSLSETVGYPSKNVKVFAAYLPITLSTTWSYATSLALTYFDNFSHAPSIEVSSFISMNDANDTTLVPSLPLHFPSCSPSALRSEIYAVVLGLSALPFGSSITINTDYAQLISLWNNFVNVPFLPKLLRQPNHLLWLSIRQIIKNLDLKVNLNKVTAHENDAHNIQVDSLAKSAHSSMQPTFSPMAIYQAPCLLKFNSLPINMNIRHFLRSIADARALLSFCSMARFTALGSPALFDWADWLYLQCNSFSEDLNHLWTCPYILPELNPRLTHRSEVVKFRDACIKSFSFLKSLDSSFFDDLSALACWDFETPSLPYLWLIRGLLTAHLTLFLKQYFCLSVIYKTISPLLNDFQIELYGEIWLCRNVLFHAWEESQGITATSKLRGPFTFLRIPGFPGYPLLKSGVDHGSHTWIFCAA